MKYFALCFRNAIGKYVRVDPLPQSFPRFFRPFPSAKPDRSRCNFELCPAASTVTHRHAASSPARSTTACPASQVYENFRSSSRLKTGTGRLFAPVFAILVLSSPGSRNERIRRRAFHVSSTNGLVQILRPELCKKIFLKAENKIKIITKVNTDRFKNKFVMSVEIVMRETCRRFEFDWQCLWKNLRLIYDTSAGKSQLNRNAGRREVGESPVRRTFPLANSCRHFVR